MIKYTIQEIIDWVPSFLSWRMLFLLHLSFEGVTEVDTDPKTGFYTLRLLPLIRVLCLCHSKVQHQRAARKGGAFLKDYKIICQKKGNDNKIILGDLNCTMDKVDRDGKNKTQITYRCCSNYALSKLIVDNGLEDLLRRENQYSPESILI